MLLFKQHDLVCREVAARFIVLQCIHANSITNHTSDVNHIFPVFHSCGLVKNNFERTSAPLVLNISGHIAVR